MKTLCNIEIGTKNSHGKYLRANTELIRALGYKKKQDVIGRSEYDIGREIFQDSIEGSDALTVTC